MSALNITCAEPNISCSCSFSSASPSAKSTWSYGGSTPAYSYGGNTFNSSGYLSNSLRSAQIQARDARAKARQMGLPNRR
jgi:hypothetical protein